MSASQFRAELETLINAHSMENGSDTPDFILAEYLTDCLTVFDKALQDREKWYGRASRRVGGSFGPIGLAGPEGEPPSSYTI